MDPPKVYLSWADVEQLADELVTQIRASGQEYDVILGIARGGMYPALMMAQVLEHGMTMTCHLRRYQRGATTSDAPPKIVVFPGHYDLQRQRVLIVDEVWDFGHSAVMTRTEAIQLGAARVDIAVLHFKPERNCYPDRRPTYAAGETNDWIVYPWEAFADRHLQPSK